MKPNIQSQNNSIEKSILEAREKAFNELNEAIPGLNLKIPKVPKYAENLQGQKSSAFI